MSKANTSKQFTEEWGLWAHCSWRDLVVNGSIATITAFAAYFASTSGKTYAYTNLAQDTTTLAAGFFFSYTAMHYPSFKKNHQIKNNNLHIFMLLGQKLSEIEREYYWEQSHPKIEIFIQSVNEAARSCLDLPAESNSKSNLLTISKLMLALNERLELFASELPKSLESLDEEIKFWQQDALSIKDQLLPFEGIIEHASFFHNPHVFRP